MARLSSRGGTAGATANVVTRLAKTGLRRGVFEGSRGWLYVGVAATALRVMRRVLSEPETVEIFELKPGETVEIRTVAPKR
jgi:hypothetical protein